MLNFDNCKFLETWLETENKNLVMYCKLREKTVPRMICKICELRKQHEKQIDNGGV